MSLILSVTFAECNKKAVYAERHYAERHYAECHYAECHLCAVMLSVITLNVIMLSVIMLNVVMLSVVAPKKELILLKFCVFRFLVINSKKLFKIKNEWAWI